MFRSWNPEEHARISQMFNVVRKGLFLSFLVCVSSCVLLFDSESNNNLTVVLDGGAGVNDQPDMKDASAGDASLTDAMVRVDAATSNDAAPEMDAAPSMVNCPAFGGALNGDTNGLVTMTADNFGPEGHCYAFFSQSLSHSG